MKAFYRPEWTCGRYDLEHRVALMYNLMVGENFFFENLSAQVIGHILGLKKNSEINIKEISSVIKLPEETIVNFLNQLCKVGLIINKIPNNTEIPVLRTNLGNKRKKDNTNNTTQIHTKKESDNNAEQAYNNAVKKTISSAILELTYECSAKCIHCYNPGASRNDNEIDNRKINNKLSASEYKSLIDELYTLGCYKVTLTGGDPFSSPLIWDIMNYLNEKEIAFNINTNGIYLSTHMERIFQYYPRCISVSLYSAIPEIHDSITRIKGSFKKTLNLIKQVSEIGIPLIIKCCIMRVNVKSYYTVEDVAKQYGAKVEFEVSLIDALDGDRCVSNSLLLTPQMLNIVLRDRRINLYVGKEIQDYGALIRKPNDRTCNAGDSGLCVSPSGDIRLCVSHPYVLSNIRNQSVAEMIKSNEYLQKWKQTTLKDFETCGKFDYCSFCMICAANNFSSSGSALKACENNCIIAKCRFNIGTVAK